MTKCLPFDTMHTIFEGGARLDLQRLLFHLIASSGYITLAKLNTRITALPYGYSETDTKPGPIEQDSSGSYGYTHMHVMYVSAGQLRLIKLVLSRDTSCSIGALGVGRQVGGHVRLQEGLALLNKLMLN